MLELGAGNLTQIPAIVHCGQEKDTEFKLGSLLPTCETKMIYRLVQLGPTLATVSIWGVKQQRHNLPVCHFLP